MPFIHPTAIVDPGTKLEQDVTIGPYCVSGPDVRLKKGVQLVAHVVVTGHTTIGPQYYRLSFRQPRPSAAGFEIQG